MNNLFEKNIHALAQKDLAFAERVSRHIENDVPQLVQENGFYNFVYKNKNLHNPLNPLGEAQEIFAGASNEPVTIHLLFGLGLGYLFQVASANSKGTVIVYEPDLNIVKCAFKLVDFSRDIIKTNVYITDNLEDVCKYIYWHSNTQNTPLLLSTKTYRDLYGEKFNELVENLQRQIGRYNLDRKYTEEKFYTLSQRLFKGIPNLISYTPLLDLKDVYQGKTAVVVSAGPTLDRNIATIKKYRDKIVLIVVGTAIKAISANGITPDFLTIIETNDCSKQIQGIDLTSVNFITEPISHPHLANHSYKKIYSHIAANNPINAYWGELTGIDTTEYLSKGTVSYTAINAARILGCKKIVLVGQDLAYIEGQCYSKDSAYKDLVCAYNEIDKKWEIKAKDFDNFCASLGNSKDTNVQIRIAKKRLKDLNDSLYYVKGIKGDMLPTESVYAAFITPLSEYTKLYPDRKYINTSLVGAAIEGFENIPLEEALADAEEITDRGLNVDYKYDIPKIVLKLKAEMQSLRDLQNNIEVLQRQTKNLNNDIKRYRVPTPELLKTLKKVFLVYSEIHSKNKIFDIIIASERIAMDYEMKMTKEFNINNIQKLSDKITKFSCIANKKLSTIQNILTMTVNKLGDKT